MSQFNFIESEKRPWGSFYVVHDEKNIKLKELKSFRKRLSYSFILKDLSLGQ